MNNHPRALLGVARAAAIITVAALAVVGCSLFQPAPVEYVSYEVRVPVPTPCSVAVPKAPARETEKLKRADSVDDKSKAMLADLKSQEGHIKKLEAATDGCR